MKLAGGSREPSPGPPSCPPGKQRDFGQANCQEDLTDPLADVLEWLGRTKYDARDASRHPSLGGSFSEEAPMADICEESPHRGGPAHAHDTRQMLPKLEKLEHGRFGPPTSVDGHKPTPEGSANANRSRP